MIYIICNNAKSKTDGIGDYAYKVYNSISNLLYPNSVSLYSGICVRTDFLGKFFSINMSKTIFQVTRRIARGDVIILEYPFNECNPVILFFLTVLKWRISREKGALILSLHEYFRVSSFRQFIIRRIIRKSDAIMVTDHKTKGWIEKMYKKEVYIRTIPSNIFIEPNDAQEKDRHLYLFFGLISKTKAFEEMLTAWRKFNIDKQNRLIIISSSLFENTYEDDKVYFRQGLGEEDVRKLFMAAEFCILPIIPTVSINNTTYKTALCYDCIPIGCFSNEISRLDGHICLNGNGVNDIYEGLMITSKMSEIQIEDYRRLLMSLPKQTSNNTAKEYIKIVNSLGFGDKYSIIRT